MLNNTWQTIDTAQLLDENNEPKLMLLFVPHSMGGYCFVGCKYKDEWIDNLNTGFKYEPTHWIELPTPPNNYSFSQH